MTTKEQELKALNKIKALVAELGEDSYIATAFEGCFEIAEENIKNDFACSMKQRVAVAQKRAEEAEERARQAEKRAEKAEADAKKFQRALDDARETRNEWMKAAEEIKAKWNAAENKLDEKDLEIIKLKARLFDMMNA
jgi:HD-GYP domain-containing protein (c-di-GMP phosphodiesterase class II)